MSDSREKRMEAWRKLKLAYRNGGGRNWKARKKLAKRVMRSVRRQQAIDATGPST